MRRRVVGLGVAVLLALTCGTSARAATLQIQFTGLDLEFDGNILVDAGSPLGGGHLPSQSDTLDTLDFFVDGVLVGSLTSNIYADVGLFGVGHIPVGGGQAQVLGGMFDLFSSALGRSLSLNVNSATLLYTGGQFAISGGSVDAEIFDQDLPFDLSIGEPIEVLFLLGALSNVTDNGQWLTGFDGSGAGAVQGVAVPEPTTLLLLGAGLLGVTTRVRRRIR